VGNDEPCFAGNAHLAEHLQTSHVVAENFADVMKEILPIDECKGTLDGWLDGHEASKKITRLRPFRAGQPGKKYL
jgi:hypothetical protein